MALYGLGEHRPQLRGEGHFIAPGARVIGNIVLETNTSVWFNAVLRGDNELIHIGARSNVQDLAMLHTDPGFPLTIGQGVTVGHHAIIHGAVIGDYSLIGINAVVLNGCEIGEHCIIGANALLTENSKIESGSIVLGSPAKVSRRLNDEERVMLEQGAESYVDNALRFSEQLGVIDT